MSLVFEMKLDVRCQMSDVLIVGNHQAIRTLAGPAGWYVQIENGCDEGEMMLK